MKRTILIISSYALIAFVFCIGLSAVIGHIPTLLPEHKSVYTLCRGFLFFFRVLPAILCTGFLTGLAVHFGIDDEKAQMRFSPLIMHHFRSVMILSIVLVTLLVLVNEVFSPLVQKKKHYVEEAPHLLSEYIKLGRECLKEQNYVLAHRYGTQILKIKPGMFEGRDLIDRSEAVLKAIKKIPVISEGKSYQEMLPFKEIGNESVAALIQKARKALDERSWFEAHYYAQLALTAAGNKDINAAEARRLASVAWNNLTEAPEGAKSKAQQLFAKKREAYKALSKGDNVEAYYQFLEIAAQDETWSSDPDVTQFLKISRERVENQCFFIDETEKRQIFETYMDVYFTVKHDSGVIDVVYIRGITPVTNGGNLVQYLRGLTVVTYGKNGSFLKSFTVPYAKMLSVSVDSFDKDSMEKFDLKPEFKRVPYIMLESIDRNMKGKRIAPEYEFAGYLRGEKQDRANFKVLSLSSKDFENACEASVGVENASITTLMQESGKADFFGRSSEVVNGAMLNRLSNPFLMMIIFVLMAVIAWDFRVSNGHLFKFVWIAVIPVATLVVDVLIQMLLTLTEIGTFAIATFAGPSSLIVALAVFVVILVLVAFHFAMRKTNK